MNLFKFRALATGLALSVGFLGMTTVASHALTFNLTSDHCTGGCGTAQFGTVELTQVGANVQFIVDLANGPPNTVGWAQTGAGDFLLFKFNATGIVIGDITVTQTFAGQTLAAAGPGGPAPPGPPPFSGDGTGVFNWGIFCSTCGNGNLGITSNVQFLVANALISDFTTPNNLGNVFVADIFSSQTGNTGPVDATVPNPVPLPPAAFLFGTALVGLGLLG